MRVAGDAPEDTTTVSARGFDEQGDPRDFGFGWCAAGVTSGSRHLQERVGGGAFHGTVSKVPRVMLGGVCHYGLATGSGIGGGPPNQDCSRIRGYTADRILGLTTTDSLSHLHLRQKLCRLRMAATGCRLSGNQHRSAVACGPSGEARDHRVGQSSLLFPRNSLRSTGWWRGRECGGKARSG